jgi:hypothetical protein
MWKKRKERQEQEKQELAVKKEAKRQANQEAAADAAAEVAATEQPVDPEMVQILIELRDSIRYPDEWDDLESIESVGQLRSLNGLKFTDDDEIIEIALSGSGISGAIPPSITALASLRSIDFSDNELAGELPLGLIELKLRGACDVNLQDNAGFFLPSNFELGEDISRLDLRNCSLAGPFPDNLLNVVLPRLTGYAFDDNSLEILPNSLHEHLILERNTFHDTGLTDLDLSDSGMRGTIPPALTCCTSLTSLVLKRNYLRGALPSASCWSRLEVLERLDLSCNMLEGCIPQLGTASCTPLLTALDVSDNPALGGEVVLQLLSRPGLLKVDTTGCNRQGEHRASPMMRGIECWDPGRLGKFKHRLPPTGRPHAQAEEEAEDEEAHAKRKTARDVERREAAKAELEEMKKLKWELGKDEERRQAREETLAKEDADKIAKEEQEEKAKERAEEQARVEAYEQDATQWDEGKVAEEVYNIGTRAVDALRKGKEDGEGGGRGRGRLITSHVSLKSTPRHSNSVVWMAGHCC